MFEYILRLLILLPLVGGMAWGSLWLWKRVQMGVPLTPGGAKQARPVEMIGVLPLGPGTKLALLDQVPVEALAAATAEQVEALATAGADLLIFETCQDLLQVKTALVACFDTLERLGRDLPVLVSVTIESAGTMLAGCDLATVAAAA